MTYAVDIREPFGETVMGRQLAQGLTVAAAVDELMPNPQGLVIARVNGGQYLPRAAWSTVLQDGDLLEVIEHPAGGSNDSLGTALQFALATYASVLSGNPGPLFLFFASQLAAISVNDPTLQEQEQQAPTYSTGLQGNQARLFQVVPKICGRHQTFPPFASQSYTRFINHEQYLYVVLALGIGNHDIERTLIDDTDIQHFSDVLTATYLPPGVPPVEVLPHVVNSPEVGGQEMLTGEIIGGFVMCGPRSLASIIEFDVIAPFGLGAGNAAGDLESLTVRWRYDIRSVNEFGAALTAWSILATEIETDATRDARRWSYSYTLATPVRPEIRVIRLDIKSNNVRDLNNLVWSGARAVLSVPAPLNANVAHYEVVMRSSKQLTGVSQNRISVIATGMCPELLPDGTFGPEIASRNPADWLADLWISDTWGEGLEATSVDLATLADLRAVWAARQDRFDYVFDQSMDADSAAQLIAECGRARVFRRGGVRTLTRDALVTLPRTSFHTRNTLPGSMNTVEDLPLELLPDGVIVEYFDNRTWTFLPLECPSPGVTTMQRPVRIRKAGVTGRIHATREGLYEAAKIVYRREVVEASTEMQGSIPPFGSAVRWQSTVTRWKAGDVVEWTEGTLTARLSEPVEYGASPLVIVFEQDDGRPTPAIAISPGALTTDVVLATAPGITLVTEDGTRERTRYLIGGVGDDEVIAKIARIEDGGNENGAQLYRLQAFIDDARVHAVDNVYLPSPGETQDPIDTTPGEPGGGTIPVVNVDSYVFTPIGTTHYWEVHPDGTIHHNFTTGGADAVLPQQWLFVSPVEPSVAAQFEVFFELIAAYGDSNFGTEHMGVWLPCTAVYRFGGTTPTNQGSFVEFNVIFRDIATSTVQDQAYIATGTS